MVLILVEPAYVAFQFALFNRGLWFSPLTHKVEWISVVGLVIVAMSWFAEQKHEYYTEGRPITSLWVTLNESWPLSYRCAQQKESYFLSIVCLFLFIFV